MAQIAPNLERATGVMLGRVCAAVALAGGMVLSVMALITVASVIGRALTGLGLGPVRGDFELVEMGCAIAVFAFLPWCQIRRGHVSVDVLSEKLPPRGHAALGVVGNVALAVCAGVVAWRLWLGSAEKIPFGSQQVRSALGMGPQPFFPETTYELQVPVWIPLMLSLAGAALFFVVCLYSVWRSANWALAGEEPAVG